MATVGNINDYCAPAVCLKQNIACSSLCTKPAGDLDGRVSQYNTVLTDLIDKYTPAKQKTMIRRPNTDWHEDEIDVAIAARRKAEGVWRGSNLTVHHQIYREKCTAVTNIIRQAKRDVYSRSFGCWV